MKLNGTNLLVFIVIFCLILWTRASKILAIYPLACRSTFMFHMKMMKILLDRGHELTVMSKFPQNGRIANYTDINIVKDIDNYCDGVVKVDDFGSYVLSDLISYYHIQIDQLERLYANENITRLINSNQKFDLVIVEVDLFYDHYLPMAFTFNAPVVVVYTNLIPYPDTDVVFGNVVNPSWLPSPLGGLSSRMNFIQRIRNLYYYAAHFGVRFYADNVVNSIVRKSLPNSPLANELTKKVSVVFDNNHPILLSRPALPYVISVAGIHIKNESHLPEDIKKFITDAKNGVIYVSLGSTVQFSSIPAQDAFVKVFSNLPYRILWKHDKPELVNTSSVNILVRRWFPQSDILSEENVKLFISHCGLFGVYEAINSGTPILGIPIFYDQPMNCAIMEKAQLGVQLPYQKIDENTLKNTIQMLLTNNSFHENMKKASEKFKDRPLSPAETFVFWAENAIRHQGPIHSNIVGQHLSFYEYLLLDIMATMLVLLIIIYIILKKLIRLLCPTKKRDKID